MIARVMLLVALLGCDRDREPPPRPTPAPTPTPGPQAAPPRVERGADIRVAGATQAGEVLEIGRPRLRLSTDAGYAIAVGGHRVFASDRDAVAAWSITDGTPLGRWRSGEDLRVSSLTSSHDGTRIAANGRLLSVANDALTLAASFGGVAYQFTADGARVAMTRGTPVLVDVAQRRVVETAPALPSYRQTFDLDASHWIRADGAYAWDHTRNAWTQLLSAATPSTAGALASRAPVAIVADRSGLSRIDLPRRTIARSVPGAVPLLGVSPSGDRVAVNRDDALVVFDTRTGTQLASTAVSPGELTPAAFVDEDTLAFRDARDIRVFDLHGGLRRFPAPSRFIGWIDADTAAISRGSELDRLDVRSRATAPLAAATTSRSYGDAPTCSVRTTAATTTGPTATTTATPSA